MKKSAFILFVILLAGVSINRTSAQAAGDNATNPIIWADVPDPSVVKVGDYFYMSSTTMHMSPGVPIMRSPDLVNWETVSYAYDILDSSDALNMENGLNAYGKGTWASSIRYHDSLYYVATFSYTTGKTHIYITDSIEEGNWEAHTLENYYHDLSLHFEDTSTYIIYGNNEIHLLELTPDATAVKPGGLDQVIIANASSIAGTDFYVQAEGSQIFKVNGKYYLFLISWPVSGGRSVLIYRSDNITGPYEGRVALQDRGIAQGGMVQYNDTTWYAVLFQDHGAVGRIPYVVPMTWEDDWPVLGIDGKVPGELDIPTDGNPMSGIVESDEFDYEAGEPLKLVWQWNHNPDTAYWSLTERPGYLRLTNGRIDSSFHVTRNTLTQRTFGPYSAASIKLDVSGMIDGDYAGLGALQEQFGVAGVKMTGGEKFIIMIDGKTASPYEAATLPLDQEEVWLRIDMNYNNQADRAYFSYSLDGSEYTKIGKTLQMSYTLSHFMGYRFAIFSYATETTGGYVDVDNFTLQEFEVPQTPPNATESADTPATGFEIFPNPSQGGILSIRSEFPISRLSFFDSAGKLVYVQRAGGKYARDVQPNLVAGIYNIRMDTLNGKTGTQQLVVESF